ncbi:uncharacterized protein M6B38_308345 [Iris pallida]|uniref:Uncharacterized protein n=1 Tax=Iris pallida TaxID=29817 RepID=A0AAX6HKT1_IRIPA|nr:uncharacterized protein M6B38_308345 [Iris pallida]
MLVLSRLIIRTQNQGTPRIIGPQMLSVDHKCPQLTTNVLC